MAAAEDSEAFVTVESEDFTALSVRFDALQTIQLDLVRQVQRLETNVDSILSMVTQLLAAASLPLRCLLPAAHHAACWIPTTPLPLLAEILRVEHRLQLLAQLLRSSS